MTTGGLYAFDRDSGGGVNAMFGFQATDAELTPGTITLRFQNTTGSALTSIQIRYDIFTFNDQARSSSINFDWSTNDSTYTSIAALNYTSPTTGTGAAWDAGNARAANITGFSVANNGFFYMRWSTDDASGTGARDQFGLDNIRINAVPEPATIALFVGGVGGGGFYAWRRRRKQQVDADLDHAEAEPTDAELDAMQQEEAEAAAQE